MKVAAYNECIVYSLSGLIQIQAVVFIGYSGL